MTSEEAFVRAITERPEDDLNWQVYADWLEDHGNPLGELIRVHIQLEQLGETDPGRPPLKERQRELENATSFVEWKHQLSNHGFEVQCRRGFITALFLGVRWLAFHCGREPLRPFFEPLRSFLSLPSRLMGLLTTLRIRGDTNYGSEREFRLPPHFVGELLAPRCFQNLETLEIGNSTVILDAEAVVVVVTHPNLERLGELILDNHPVGDEGSRALAATGRLTHLTRLRLRGTGVGDEGARALAGSAHLATLTDLDLRYNRIGDEGARALAASAHLINLRKLKLDGNSIGPLGAAALKHRFGEVCLLPQLPLPDQSRPGDWYCWECGAGNFARRDACYECRSPRSQPLLREGDWRCPGCNAHNFARRQTCHQCKAARQS